MSRNQPRWIACNPAAGCKNEEYYWQVAEEMEPDEIGDYRIVAEVGTELEARIIARAVNVYGDIEDILDDYFTEKLDRDDAFEQIVNIMGHRGEV